MDYAASAGPISAGPRIPAVEKRVLIVPGLRGSGPGHWQTRLQAAHADYRRVLQHDWLRPRLDDWAAALDKQ